MPGFCNTPFTNIKRTAFKSMSWEVGLVTSFSKLNNCPLKYNGNLVFIPSCKFLILSMKSNSPNCQEANWSLNTSTTSSSNSCKGCDKWAAVTKPTGLNLSPTLNEWPGLAIENSDI